MTFHHILCPIDFSENTNKVLDIALKLSSNEATVLLFHHSILISAMQESDAALNFEADKELLDVSKKQLESYAEKWKNQYPSRTFKTHHSYYKSIVDDINDIVESDKIDLIVMGTHGRTGISRILMGSVAEDVLRHAKCPVFLIKI